MKLDIKLIFCKSGKTFIFAIIILPCESSLFSAVVIGEFIFYLRSFITIQYLITKSAVLKKSLKQSLEISTSSSSVHEIRICACSKSYLKKSIIKSFIFKLTLNNLTNSVCNDFNKFTKCFTKSISAKALRNVETTWTTLFEGKRRFTKALDFSLSWFIFMTGKTGHAGQLSWLSESRKPDETFPAFPVILFRCIPIKIYRNCNLCSLFGNGVILADDYG